MLRGQVSEKRDMFCLGGNNLVGRPAGLILETTLSEDFQKQGFAYNTDRSHAQSGVLFNLKWTPARACGHLRIAIP